MLGELLPALEGLPTTYLVGGAVRDQLRGAEPVDLDLVVEGDAAEVARTAAERLGAEALEYDRFGTAVLRLASTTVHFATSRRETYPHPGALPEVEPAPIEEDLARRDFTVNAMAMALPDGALLDHHGGKAVGKRQRRIRARSWVPVLGSGFLDGFHWVAVLAVVVAGVRLDVAWSGGARAVGGQ